MRKFAVGLLVLVLASIITCDAADAGSQGFFRSPVFFHQPSFFPQPSLISQPSFFHRPFFLPKPSFFRKPFFENRTFFFLSFPVIIAPYYQNYYPLYYAPYYPSYDYGSGNAPATSTQQAPEAAAPSEPAAPQVWYYCNPQTGYHPYVKSCSAGWYEVSTPPPSSAPQP